MTNRREQVKKALWYLEREPMPLRDPAAEAARRYRIAASIDARVRALSEEKKKDAFRVRVGALACAAAVVFGAGLLWVRGTPRTPVVSSSSPVLELDVNGPVSIVHDGKSLVAGGVVATRILPLDELLTEERAHARAVLANGAVVDVDSSTSLRFDENAGSAAGWEQLGLERGTIALKVPKLGPHRRLSIRTPNAMVTVRGTEFRVDVHEHDGHPTTAVNVVEGSVWVTSEGHEITLEKGSEWSSESSAPASPPASVTTAEQQPVSSVSEAAPTPASPNARASSGSLAAGGLVHEEIRSTLGAENDQYQRGVTAARANDDRKALAAFEAFLLHYPSSPLAQSAEVERFRALKRLGRVEEASRRARQYLARYPAGFARVEAQSLAVESLGSPSNP